MVCTKIILIVIFTTIDSCFGVYALYSTDNCFTNLVPSRNSNFSKLHSSSTLDIYSALTETELELPLNSEGISAGFPSPATQNNNTFQSTLPPNRT